MNKIKDITFHYTKEEMVKDLIAIIKLNKEDVCLDAGSGKNKVWYNNFPVNEKYECELEEGNDFMDWNKKVDWIIGNPPFHQSWKFTEKALDIASKGIAFLVNNQALNSHFTPRRIQTMKDRGFFLNHIRVVADKRWFGRYYFIIFRREDKNFLSNVLKTY